MDQSGIFGAPEAIVLLVYVPAEVEMTLISHYDFGRKIGHFVLEIEDGLGVGYTHWTIDRQQLMHGLDF